MTSSQSSFFSTLREIAQDKRLITILAMGFLSGFPWVVISTWISITLKDREVSLTTIGIAGLPALFYAFNLLWGPICDKYQLYPVKRLNNSTQNQKNSSRLSWIMVTGLGIFIATLGCTLVLPSASEELSQYWLFSIGILFIALCGSIADVNIDAQRIELFDVNESNKQGLGATCTTIGWWLGYGISGAVLLFGISDLLDASFEHAHQFGILLPIIMYFAVLLLVFKLLRSNQRDVKAKNTAQILENTNTSNSNIAPIASLVRHSIGDYVKPVFEFFYKNGWQLALTILSIIFLFKIGEAFLGRMSLVFYRDIGFTHSQIAIGSKLTGTLTVCIAAVFGGLLNLKYGVFKSLIVGGILMASTNLLFALLAVTGPNMPLFVTAVVLDQITSGISTVAFVAFISCLCQREHTATQYAAFSSLANATRTTIALSSGFVVENILHNSWPIFFILTAVLVLPGLILLMLSQKSINSVIEKNNQ